MPHQIFAVILGLPLTVCSAAAQTSYQPPRLPDGKPDLQGVWDFRTLTPLERPDNVSSKARLTTEEAADLEAKAAARSAAAFASRSAASSVVRRALLETLSGRSSGVSVRKSQTPCRSGFPSGRRGGWYEV